MQFCTCLHSNPSSPERSPVRNVSDEQISSLRRGLVAYKKKWIVFCMKSNSQCKSQVSAISYPSFLLEFGGYHIEQVIDNVAFIKSFNDIMNYIEIWRLCHAIEIWKLMKGLFADLVDETLPDAPVEDTDVSEDNCDDDDWLTPQLPVSAFRFCLVYTKCLAKAPNLETNIFLTSKIIT